MGIITAILDMLDRRKQGKGMIPELYKAAQASDWVLMKNYGDQFLLQQTANKNTVLHVLAQFCNSVHAADVARLILKREPRLLLARNNLGENALHLAAKKGHLEIARALIDVAKRSKNASRRYALLRRTDVYRNTALHNAVANNCYEIVKLLVEEDFQHRYLANIARESPLYIAVEKSYHDIAALILSTCSSPTYRGPDWTTALHAAAKRNLPPECMRLILEKLPNITKHADRFGWTALHYAAKCNHEEVVEPLLSKDKSMAYHASVFTNDRNTALHVAVNKGHLDVIKEILLHVPDCWEKTTRRHQNILHLTVQNEHQHVLEFILEQPWAGDLINQKDFKGNTPLHLYVTTNNLQGKDLVRFSGVDINLFNKAGLTPLDMLPKDEKVTDRQRSIRDEFKEAGATLGMRNIPTIKDEAYVNDELKTTDSWLLVATLIITVTFAAGFTVPGGFDSSEGPSKGMAILARKTAFVSFVVSDSLAMLVSIYAVLVQLLPHRFKDLSYDIRKLRRVKAYIGTAMALMLIAFVTGLYAVLPTRDINIYIIVVAAVFGAYLFPYITMSFERAQNVP